MLDAELEAARLIRASEIRQLLGGCSRRTLYDRIQGGEFPQPDRPAKKRGEADLWRKSTVLKGIEDFFARRAVKAAAKGAACASDAKPKPSRREGKAVDTGV